MTNVGIYKITSPSGKVYIGQSINIKSRISHYKILHKAMHSQRKLYMSFLKYGVGNHEIKVVHDLPTDVNIGVLNTYEKLYMELYKDCGVELMNIREGGNNGRHSEETKQKQRLNGNLGRKMSEDTRLKLSESLKGKPSFMKGRKHSAESKAKMSQSQRNRGYKPVGRPISEEHKIKMQEARKKVPHPMIGKHHSQESKDKVSKTKTGCRGTRNKKVICTITGKVYGSAKEAALSIGVNHSTLIAQLNGANSNKTTFIYQN